VTYPRALLLSIAVVLLVSVFPVGLCAQAPEYSLEDLYRLVLKQADRIKIAEEDVVVAEQEKNRAFSYLVPRLTASGDYRRYDQYQVGSSGSYVQPTRSSGFTVRLDQSVSLGGRELTGFRITKTGIERSRFDLSSVQEDYLQRVAVTYYALFRAKRAIEIQQTNVARLTKYRDASQTRLKVGEVTKTTVLRAQAELSGASSELVKAQNAYDLTKVLLARIVGLSGDFTVKQDPYATITVEEKERMEGQLSIDGCQPLDLECLKNKAFAQRPDLRSLELQRKIAEDQISFVRGAYFPTLSLEGAYVGRDEKPQTGGLVNDSLFGGIRLSLPIFEGGLRQAEVSQAQARERQARYALEDGKKGVGIEVESAYLELRTQVGILKSLEDQLAFSRDNYGAVAKQFEFGLASSLDVLDANTQLVTAERQMADAQFDYQLSLVRLTRSTGTLLKTVMNTR
jgi:outer membrane protein